MLRKFNRVERSWIMYDWANSAFAAIISAIILPNFYTTLTQGDVVAGSWWGYATSIATCICAICAPLFGTLGDYPGWKKRLFTIFALVGIAATAALGFTAQWQMMLVFYIIGTIGFNGSCVFYDGFLPDVTTPDRMDTVSTYGFALGYIGGSTIPLLMSMVLIMMPDAFHIDSVQACQISFIITAVWWLVFTVPMWRNVHQLHSVPQQGNVLRQTVRRLGKVGRQILRNKPLLRFMLAYFFYIDGVGTIIHMATVFGLNMGLNSTHMIVILMVLQLIAFPFAILYGRLAQRYSVRNTILLGIVTYMVVCFTALLLDPLARISDGALLGGFIFLAALVGTAQGGIQALSRSFFGKLVPAESANEYFGFYDIFGKFSAIIGPSLFSIMWSATGQVFLGVVPVLCMFVIGMLLFLSVPKDMERLATEN